MVDVADRRITERVAALPIPPHDQLSEIAVEVAAMWIATDQRPADGCGVEPTPPQLSFAGRHEVAGQIGRQRSVAVQLRRGLVVAVQQRIQPHHDLHFDVHIGCLGLSGEPFHQRVSHDLIAAAWITGSFQSISLVAQRLQTSDALLSRQISRQHAHRVRRRPQRHPTVLPFGPAAVHIPLRIRLIGMPAGTRRGTSRPHLRDPSRAELPIHLTSGRSV